MQVRGGKMFTRKFERRVYVAVGTLACAGVLGVTFGVFLLLPSRREAGYTPPQPIAFSHKIHAGTLQMDCAYCHTEVEKGPHATVPPVSLCMNCHTEVQPKDASGALRPGIATLVDHWERREPLRWNKVNDVADFVYFDHSRHVNSGVSCQTCHGPVETMDHMRREEGLKMRWCLECHMQEPAADSAAALEGRDTKAPINCTACHR